MITVNNRFFIVGDTFSGTAEKIPEILTETQTIDYIASCESLESDVYLYSQQGVDLRSLSAAVTHFNTENGIQGGLFYLVPPKSAPRATKRLAHKSRSENILISAPRRLTNQCYVMDLFFSSQNEFFLDHMTGMHIQGMALIEAARQAFLAVTEAFYLHGKVNDYYFVIKKMDVSYTRFVFPFDAKLKYDIKGHSEKDGRFSFEADIEILQGDVVCTTVKVAFTAFEGSTIAEKERDVAHQCFTKLLDEYTAEEFSIPLSAAVV